MDKPIRTMLSIQATPDIAGIRTAELMGQDHTVIPCVALVEGVLWPANAPGPELALAEEFGRFPAGWDGRPVMFDHPKVDGKPVPASSPDVLQNTSFGQLFNTKLEDGKLKTEIWINEARVPELDEDAQLVIQNLKDGEGMAEVSTGLFTQQEPIEGVFNGDEYTSIWRNIVPDHLAVLPEGIKGACSIEDGAGAPRLNAGKTGCMRALQLRELNDDPEPGDEQEGIFKRMLEAFGGLLNFKSNSEGMSDSDIRVALNAATSEVTEGYIFILAVYDNSFVYESGWDGKLFENTFSIDEGGSISIGSEPVPVRPMTTFVPVIVAGVTTNSNPQENAMNEKLVNDLIANERTQFTEDNREWLMTLEEDQLNTLVPVAAETAPAVVVEEEEEVVTNAPISTEDFIASASPEIQAVLKSGLQMHQKRKEALIKGLIECTQCTFTEDQLKAKDVEELEALSSLAQVPSFEGLGANLTTNEEEEDTGFTPAVQIFSINPAADA